MLGLAWTTTAAAVVAAVTGLVMLVVPTENALRANQSAERSEVFLGEVASDVGSAP